LFFYRVAHGALPHTHLQRRHEYRLDVRQLVAVNLISAKAISHVTITNCNL
jgi:hypothetical protein